MVQQVLQLSTTTLEAVGIDPGFKGVSSRTAVTTIDNNGIGFTFSGVMVNNQDKILFNIFKYENKINAEILDEYDIGVEYVATFDCARYFTQLLS